MKLKLVSDLSDKAFRIALSVIVVLAIAIRLFYFFSYHPPLVPFEGDSPAYDVPAWNIVQGEGYVYERGQPFASREPGYALFWLVPVYFLFGHSVVVASVMQLALDVAMLLLVVHFLKKTTSKPIALCGGALYAVYLPFVFQNAEILTEPIYQFGLLLIAIFFTRVLKNPRWETTILLGILVGAVALIRWGVVLLPPFIFIVFLLLFKNWRQVIFHSFLLLVGMTLITAPWLIRNYLLFDQFIFGRIGGGEIYWSGSYIPYDGEWRGDTEESRNIRGNLSLVEQDKKFTREALQNIKNHPLQVLWIWIKKPYKIYLFPEALNYINRTGVPLLQTGNIVMYVVLAYAILLHWLLGVAMIWSIIKRKFSKEILFSFSAIIVFSLVLYLPLNPVPRYNVPIMPLVIILASPSIYALLQYAQSRLGFWQKRD